MRRKLAPFVAGLALAPLALVVWAGPAHALTITSGTGNVYVYGYTPSFVGCNAGPSIELRTGSSMAFKMGTPGTVHLKETVYLWHWEYDAAAGRNRWMLRETLPPIETVLATYGVWYAFDSDFTVSVGRRGYWTATFRHEWTKTHPPAGSPGYGVVSFDVNESSDYDGPYRGAGRWCYFPS